MDFFLFFYDWKVMSAFNRQSRQTRSPAVPEEHQGFPQPAKKYDVLCLHLDWLGCLGQFHQQNSSWGTGRVTLTDSGIDVPRQDYGCWGPSLEPGLGEKLLVSTCWLGPFER